jgi:hypothetical protein
VSVASDSCGCGQVHASRFHHIQGLDDVTQGLDEPSAGCKAACASSGKPAMTALQRAERAAAKKKQASADAFKRITVLKHQKAQKKERERQEQAANVVKKQNKQRAADRKARIAATAQAAKTKCPCFHKYICQSEGRYICAGGKSLSGREGV